MDQTQPQQEPLPYNHLPKPMRLLRYPILAFTYTLGIPLARLADRAGAMKRVGNSMTHKAFGFERMKSSLGSYQPTEHDVFVSVYFKSGTNWLMQIAHQIATRGAGEFRHIYDVVPWPDAPGVFDFPLKLEDDSILRASPTGLRVIKSHLPMNYIPIAPEARYLYMARDPKDACVSGYLFSREMAWGPLMMSVDSWIDLFLADDFTLGVGPWAEHVCQAWQHRNEPNVLFLTFKDLKADLPGEVRRIARFMGVDLTEAELAQVVEKSSFQYMKGINEKFFPGIISPWTNTKGSVIRKGQSGSSGELLTVEQQRRIDQHMLAALEQLNCDFPYAEKFSLA